MRLAKKQAGMTFISWMIILALAGFLAIFFIKLVPVYIENFTVRSILTGMNSEQGSDYSSMESVREAVKRRFSINNVHAVEPKDVLIEDNGSGYSLTLDYEVRVPFAYNIDLVARFSEKAQVPRR